MTSFNPNDYRNEDKDDKVAPWYQGRKLAEQVLVKRVDANATAEVSRRRMKVAQQIVKTGCYAN